MINGRLDTSNTKGDIWARGKQIPSMKTKLTKVAVSLPFGLGKAEWTPDDAERRAAWSLYVELVTRVAVEGLPDERGLLREALASLYSLFPTTRAILREAGPSVGAAHPTVGWLAINVLNRGLRPFLATWHPLLLEWEAARPAGHPPNEHEREWDRHAECREALGALREQLERYAEVLGQAAGVRDQVADISLI